MDWLPERFDHPVAVEVGLGDHVALPAGQVSQDGALARDVRPGRELADEAAGDAGSDQGFACGDHADCVEELLRRGVLQQEPRGSGPEDVVHILVEVEGGEQQPTLTTMASAGRDAIVAASPTTSV